MSEPACYLYGISRYIGAADLAGIRGLGGEPVRAVDSDTGLVGIINTVDLADFGEEALERHLQDLTWLADTAQTHHGVLCDIAAKTPVAPLRLATVCLGESSVRARLERSASALHSSLDLIAGCAEWSVKVFAEPPVPADDAEATVSAGTARSGREYLARRQAQVSRRHQAAARASAVADNVYTEVAAHSIDARKLALQDARLTGESAPMTLNAAFLVGTDATPAFRAAVESLRARYERARIEYAGPWPAYSFVSVGEP